MPLNDFVPSITSEDDKLMQQIAQGHMDAFETLVNRYQDKAIRFCYGQLNDYHLAEDVSQEAFLRIYKYAGKYQPQGNFNAFFNKMMLNLCKNSFKKQNKNPVILNCPEPDILIGKPVNSSSLQALESEESRNAVRSAIDKLPPKYREVIILRELEELKYNEIAELLKISVNKVKIRLYRGRTQLAELLKSLSK